LVILHTLGITFKPQTRSLLRTGIIDLSTIPPEANVYINNRRHPETTPTTIHNLPPGNYQIKVALNNYKPWKKILPVEEKKATSVDTILLIPKQWKPQRLTVSTVEDLIPIPKQPMLLLDKGPLLKNLYHYNLKEGLKSEIFENSFSPSGTDFTALFPGDFPYGKEKLFKYYTADGSPFVLIQIKAGQTNKFFRLNLSQNPVLVNDISPLFSPSARPEQVLWNRSDPDSMITVSNGTVGRLDIGSMAVHPKIAVNAISVALYRQHLYVLTSDHLIKRVNFDGSVDKILLNDAKIGRQLFDKAKKIQMTVYGHDLILFLTEKGSLISNLLPYTLIEKGVKGFEFDEDSGLLLVWTKNKIGVLDFSQKKEKGIFELGPALTWLNIKANDIQQGLFVNQGAHIIYNDQNLLLITETYSIGQPVTHEIVPVKKGTLVQYSDKNGKLFYIDRKTSYLSHVQVIPENTFFTSAAPEEFPEEKIDDEI
jgi:hypothetical protein